MIRKAHASKMSFTMSLRAITRFLHQKEWAKAVRNSIKGKKINWIWGTWCTDIWVHGFHFRLPLHQSNWFSGVIMP